jgi:hypothetical protein
MAKILIRTIEEFFGGITLDDKPRVIGVGSNFEEIDIFTNKNFIQAEQIFSADTIPATSELYDYSVGDDDILYGYGKETAGNKVRLFKLENSSAPNPGSWATLFTSSSGDTAKYEGVIQAHETDEGGAKKWVYYLAGTGELKRYGDLDGTPAEESVGTLSGLTGSWDKPFMKRIYGELYIGHGNFIARVDDNGNFEEKAFTIPNGWKVVDMIARSDTALILCRNENQKANSSIIFQWDLIATTQFDDSIEIPKGGAQWIVNHKENIRICCAINGEMSIFQISGSFPIETHTLDNIGTETSTQAISPAKSVAIKENVLYFGLFKTDKSGLYAIGQTDETTPPALILTKRFSTGDYSDHKPTALFIQGSNFYASYDDDQTAKLARCETENSPARSSQAVYETIWLDFGSSSRDKHLKAIDLATYPLPASTKLALSVATDYNSSYTDIKRPDETDFDNDDGVMGYFTCPLSNKKVFRIKIAFTSSTTNSVKLVSITMKSEIEDELSNK